MGTVSRRCGPATHTPTAPARARARSHVILPKELAKTHLKSGKLLSDAEWRGIGVQQSRGWEHYAIHRPEPHSLLFRRPLGCDPMTGKVRASQGSGCSLLTGMGALLDAGQSRSSLYLVCARYHR